MTARILGEGPFDIPDRYLAGLDTLDDALNEAVESGDRIGFASSVQMLQETVHRVRTPLPDRSLTPSGLVLPARGMSLTRVTALLSRSDLAPLKAPAGR